MDAISQTVADKATTQIMVFTIGTEYFAVDIDEILEILMAADITPLQQAQLYIEGVFKQRDKIITVVDIAAYFGLNKAGLDREIFIITSDGDNEYAFHVDSVVGMQQLDSSQISEPDRIVYGGQGVVTGIVEINDRLISILDFKKILISLGH